MSAAMKGLSSVSGGLLGNYPAYGMSMRFKVGVDGLGGQRSLGHWSSCEGLAVRLETKPVETGGTYTRRVRLPEKLTFPPVKLKRAMQRKESEQVQDFLKDYVENWDKYSDPMKIKRTTVTIVLLDYQLEKVIKWELEDAYPVSWEGPSLQANDNKIAIETLTFEHEGFLL